MGLILKIPAVIIFFVAGFWGFWLCLDIVVRQFGFIGGVIAFMFFPITVTFAPWYEALANSNWFPLILIYGGGIPGAILFAIGSAIDSD